MHMLKYNVAIICIVTYIWLNYLGHSRTKIDGINEYNKTC